MIDLDEMERLARGIPQGSALVGLPPNTILALVAEVRRLRALRAAVIEDLHQEAHQRALTRLREAAK